MKLENGESLLFVGDSITDCGRARPVGMGGGLGCGYVSLVDSALTACCPQKNIRVVNAGIGGNRVTDLDARWKEDVLDHRPDWLSVMIGINDVWCQFGDVVDPSPVTIGRYERVYRKVLAATRPTLKGLVLLSPFFLEANLDDPMRSMMDAYGGIVKKLSVEFDAVFVDVQGAFDEYLLHRTSESLSGDRVHPNNAGHMIIARAFLHAIDFDWTPAFRADMSV